MSSKIPTEESKKKIVSTFLNLSDKQFFNASEKLLHDIEWRLLDTDFEGLVINAPMTIQIDKADQLPLFMATRRSGERGWEVLQDENCILVATDLNTGDVYFGEAFPIPEGKTPLPREDKPREKPKASALPDSTSKVYRFDIRKHLNLWKPGKYSMAIISYDWLSNIIEVELKGNKSAEIGTTKQVFPQPNTKATKKIFGLFKKEVFPSFTNTSESPKLPKKGISFVIKPRLIVYGSFSTKAKAYHIPKTTTTHKVNGEGRTVAAIVPMTFAIVGLDWHFPLRFDWAIPVYSGQKIKEGDKIEGHFAIDLSDQKLSKGKYLAYIVMDEGIYGPVKFKY